VKILFMQVGVLMTIESGCKDHKLFHAIFLLRPPQFLGFIQNKIDI
jgi:hypothetical protein